MPPPITAHVATVRHRTSVPAKFQMASRQATTATRMHALVVQKEIFVTMRGLRKPLRTFSCSEPARPFGVSPYNTINCLIGFTASGRLRDRRVLHQAESRPRSAKGDGGHRHRSTFVFAFDHFEDRPASSAS